ncbi:hypothetical protein OHA72_09970 [Dactylosporangium sp. NBC_01737]|uniref:hypothetical protein n=1 Tax=Dactylosporangium sp. NBC_01737 TaxID=2975959 RepID=UPI002E0E2ABF|nr:hypothetical protein OHA72_09970 [Dactylosporangium sp. NBC_01737]
MQRPVRAETRPKLVTLGPPPPPVNERTACHTALITGAPYVPPDAKVENHRTSSDRRTVDPTGQTSAAAESIRCIATASVVETHPR